VLECQSRKFGISAAKSQICAASAVVIWHVAFINLTRITGISYANYQPSFGY